MPNNAVARRADNDSASEDDEKPSKRSENRKRKTRKRGDDNLKSNQIPEQGQQSEEEGSNENAKCVKANVTFEEDDNEVVMEVQGNESDFPSEDDSSSENSESEKEESDKDNENQSSD